MADSNQPEPLPTIATPQPPPTPGRVNVIRCVMADLAARAAKGTEKYGTPLHTHNGRDSLMDAYQEAIDLCCYLRQAIEERNDETKQRQRNIVDAASEGGGYV